MADILNAGLSGENLFWTTVAAITVSSTNLSYNVTNAKMISIHITQPIYINFSASSTAASSTANDLILLAGLHNLIVPKAIGNIQYFNYVRQTGTGSVMRLVLS